jgi:hypothetical protein
VINAVIYEDAFNMLCGTLLGEGVHRRVFECKLRPELVVKVEYETDYRWFANVHEMKFWNEATADVQKWLTPCEFLSPDGRILLQRRVLPVRDSELPDKLPAFLVCVDYAMVSASPNMRMRNAIWV